MLMWSMIKLIDVHKSFKKQTVLDGVNLEIEDGKTTVIIGRSGGGKSVLLKHIIGLLKPDSGQILVDDVDISRLHERDLNEVRKKFGMLFQEGALFDSMTVGDNIAFPLREHTKMKESEIKEIVAEKLKAVGLTGVEGKMPSELSGGMRKRVGLARAIAINPKNVLFDDHIAAKVARVHHTGAVANLDIVVEHHTPTNHNVVSKSAFFPDAGKVPNQGIVADGATNVQNRSSAYHTISSDL